MLSGYNPKSCNALEKAHYSPLEAAIRWCGLVAHEANIMQAMQGRAGQIPGPTDFPQWPCLRINVEKICDAIANGEVRYGRDGADVPPGEHVAPARRTVRHTDLKAWMVEYHPGQKPAFLFDEIEQNTHPAITVESFNALQAERDALRARLEKAKKWWDTAQAEKSGLQKALSAVTAERDSLQAAPALDDVLEGRRKTTALRIIGGLAISAYRIDIHAARMDGITEIVRDLESAGAAVNEKTLREWLKEAANVIDKNA